MDWMVRWQALCKDHVKISTMDGKLYARTLQKISTMDLLYARTLVKKNSTMDWMVRWQALCKDHVKISTMDGKLYTRTMQKISTI